MPTWAAEHDRDLSELEALAEMPMLDQLWATGNPVCQQAVRRAPGVGVGGWGAMPDAATRSSSGSVGMRDRLKRS